MNRCEKVAMWAFVITIIVYMVVTVYGCSLATQADVTAAVARIETSIDTTNQAGHDFNDTWTLRLLAFGVVGVPFLTYIVPKFMWIFGGWAKTVILPKNKRKK